MPSSPYTHTHPPRFLNTFYLASADICEPDPLQGLQELDLFFFSDMSFLSWCRVSQPPQTLDELGESLTLWDKLNADKPTIEAKFEPLSEQFAILEKYEVPVPEEVSHTLCTAPYDHLSLFCFRGFCL